MPSWRLRRVGEQIRQELSLLLARRVRDPRLSLANLTEVEMSADLKRAYVYFTCPVGEAEAILSGFEKAAGFLKRELGAVLRLKAMPELVFRYDKSLDEGAKIERILKSLKQEDSEETA